MAVSIAAIVDRALRDAGVPIVGVSIGRPADRSTWRVEFAPGATDPQKATAQNIVNTVAVDAAAQADAQAEENAQLRLARVIVAYIWRLNHANTNPTLAQLQAEMAVVRAIDKALP